MRQLMADRQNETLLNHDGYCVVDFLTSDELDDARKIVTDFGYSKPHTTKMRITITQELVQTRREIFERLLPIVQRAADRFLQDYKVIRIEIFDKLRGGGDVRLHQHPHRVDESQFRSITIWSPLIDTTAAMGTLHVVKGSHKVFVHKIRTYNDPRAFSAISRRIKRRWSSTVPLLGGQAIIFDDRMLHWSPPNRTSLNRTALMLTLIPRETSLEIYYRTDAHECVKYAIDERIYRESVFPLTAPPDHLSVIGRVTEPYLDYVNKTFVAMMRRSGLFEQTPRVPFLKWFLP